MGETKLTFKRYEKKYLLSAETYRKLRAQLDEHIKPDRFFSSTVCSVYYDTDDYSLIRHSLEKPVYKEKLRLRSYNTPAPDGEVFIELKKKYKGIVYKRRVGMPAALAEAYLRGEARPAEDTQIIREIDWFLHCNHYSPKVLVACDRTAYVSVDDPELRITFDHDIRCRDTDLSLLSGGYGEPLMQPGEVLMELKVPGAAPMWLARLLSDLKIFPQSFSKYGNYYKNQLVNSIFME